MSYLWILSSNFLWFMSASSVFYKKRRLLYQTVLFVYSLHLFYHWYSLFRICQCNMEAWSWFFFLRLAFPLQTEKLPQLLFCQIRLRCSLRLLLYSSSSVYYHSKWWEKYLSIIHRFCLPVVLTLLEEEVQHMELNFTILCVYDWCVFLVHFVPILFVQHYYRAAVNYRVYFVPSFHFWVPTFSCIEQADWYVWTYKLENKWAAVALVCCCWDQLFSITQSLAAWSMTGVSQWTCGILVPAFIPQALPIVFFNEHLLFGLGPFIDSMTPVYLPFCSWHLCVSVFSNIPIEVKLKPCPLYFAARIWNFFGLVLLCFVGASDGGLTSPLPFQWTHVPHRQWGM